MTLKNYLRDKPTLAYLLLVICLALHVADEANHHFLDFYNPLALKIREYLFFFPPTFSFQIWITGLCLAILLLLLLAPFVYSRNKRMIPAARIFSVVMILNGLGHIAASFYYGKIMAGMVTSPFLIFFSVWFIYQNRKKSPSRS
jgi:hypothetical protein